MNQGKTIVWPTPTNGPFEKFLQGSGCGGHPLHTILDNLDGGLIEESVEDYVQLRIKQKESNEESH